jgi:hypothetical protein
MPLYFAYGSNMDSEQMKKRCPNYKYIGKGFLSDHTIAFTRYSITRNSSVADVIQKTGELVWGILYRLTEEDITRMDRHEGHPNIYARKTVTIDKVSNDHFAYNNAILPSNEYEKVSAEIYEVVNKEEQPNPSLEYLKHLLDGAFENFLPISYQKFLYEFGISDYNSRLNAIIDFFLFLEDNIRKGFFPDEAKSHDEWGGANLVITGNLSRKEQLNKDYPHDLVILTPHWHELSWLVNKIYWDDTTTWKVDYTNKYGILNELGRAALDYQKKYPDDDSPIGISLSVLYCAYKIYTSDLYKHF